MRIGIDISPIIYETGVSWYVYNLVKNLLLLDKANDYILFGGSLRRYPELKKKTAGLRGNFQTRFLPLPPALLGFMWNTLHALPVESLVGPIDVFHSSDWTQPPTKSFKVTTIHDLTPIKYPKLSHPRIVSVHTSRFKWIKKEANAVIVPSQSTKKDLLELGIPENRIFVIPEATDPMMRPVGREEVLKLKRRYRISGKYLLAVGVAERKNIKRAIEAFERVRAGQDLKLVVVGEQKVKIEPSRGVIFVGHVPFHELPAFYTGAQAFIYPSLYEGFGLPILEAYACGTPVVTSNLSSMPEIAQEGAILVDPYSTDAIAEGIKEALQRAQELIKKGKERVKDFSWKKSAEMTLAVYRKALD